MDPRTTYNLTKNNTQQTQQHPEKHNNNKPKCISRYANLDLIGTTLHEIPYIMLFLLLNIIYIQ